MIFFSLKINVCEFVYEAFGITLYFLWTLRINLYRYFLIILVVLFTRHLWTTICIVCMFTPIILSLHFYIVHLNLIQNTPSKHYYQFTLVCHLTKICAIALYYYLLTPLFYIFLNDLMKKNFKAAFLNIMSSHFDTKYQENNKLLFYIYIMYFTILY